MGLMFLAWGFNSLASLLFGFLGDLLGERAVLIGAGAALCAVVSLLYIWHRRIGAADPAFQPAGEAAAPASAELD
ncbi:MAG: hypothetical protein IH998_13860 [Proteobacteria bacterium]|nr:hypothetical protein [Pseudomonadota bacterium]